MITIFDANAVLRTSLHNGFQFDPRSFYVKALTADHVHFWVWDGGRHNERRREIWPGYKIRNYDGQENIFKGLELYKELLVFSPAIQIAVPTYEADDVCYTLAKKFVAAGERVTIHTNDQDFHQIEGVTLKGVSLVDGVDRQYVTTYKALKGDSSDKIPGAPGFGPKSWEALAGHYGAAKRALAGRDYPALRALPLPPRVKSWLMDDENASQLCDFFQITTMIDVPEDLIAKHTLFGTPRPDLAEEIFARFSL